MLTIRGSAATPASWPGLKFRGYQYLAISGLRERQGMYQRMGSRPLGDPVPRGQASFAPMLLALSNLGERAQRTRDRLACIMHQEAESST